MPSIEIEQEEQLPQKAKARKMRAMFFDTDAIDPIKNIPYQSVVQTDEIAAMIPRLVNDVVIVVLILKSGVEIVTNHQWTNVPKTSRERETTNNL